MSASFFLGSAMGPLSPVGPPESGVVWSGGVCGFWGAGAGALRAAQHGSGGKRGQYKQRTNQADADGEDAAWDTSWT